ncbi:MAG: TIGR00341 family protein [Anaerolineales bacterium]|nr:TIGR00341 family protein [Anaerolineales bacterium]
MSEKEYSQQIRYSYSISLLRAISISLGVMLVISVLILMGDVISVAGSSVPLIALLTSLIVVGNLLGYVELSMSVPQPGGAYRLVQDCEEGNWLAFITGWTLLLAGIVTAGILIQGFAVQSTALIIALTGISLPQFPFAIGILVLVAGFKFLPIKKINNYLLFLIFTVILVFCLIFWPNNSINTPAQSNTDWNVPFNFLLISFIGLEITAGLQGEITKRTTNAPRAMFIAPILAGIVFAVIAGIVSNIVPSSSTALGLPLADMASIVAGKWAKVGLLILSITAIPLALNRVINLLSNQGYAMTKDGFWPETLKRVHLRSNTPIFLVIVFSILILLTLLFPLIYLAQLGGLLYLIVLMAVNFTLTRREQITSSPFNLPIHPWIPALVLVFDLLLSLTWANFFPSTGLLLLIGFLLFIGYGRHHSIKAKEGITVFKSVLEEQKTKQSIRILVPIANPDTAETLLHLAGTLVRQQGGKVIALRVITVPGQVPLSEGSAQAETDHVLLDRAIDQATIEEFRVQTMTRVSRSVSEGILDTAREEGVDQILLGWLGDTRTISNSLGPVIDPIIKEAPCDVLIVKGDHSRDIKSILVPTAGGPNAPIGASLAATLSQIYGASVTGLYVQVGRATPRRMDENYQTIDDTLEGLLFNEEPDKKVIMADNVLEGILKEAQDYDLVIVGATEQGFFDQFAFGSVPLRIAAQAPNTSIMVKGYSGTREFVFRRALTAIFNLFPTLAGEEQLEVREELIADAQPGRDYFILIVLSTIIAALGLLLNSPAVVIGAMLVAPLMSPILGFSLGVILGEGRLVRTSLESVFKGVMASIIVAILIGLLSPLKEMTPEILARTQPTIVDLFIALASGMAGAYAVSRKDVSAALPGVAIAAALAPPLSVVGLGFANGNMRVTGGALLLFTTNLVTISLGGVIIFSLLGIHPLNLQPETKKRVQKGATGILFLVFLITIPLAIIMNSIIKQTREQQTIERVLLESPFMEKKSIVDIERTQDQDQLLIIATVRSSEPLDQEAVNELAQALENELDRPLDLDLIILPVIRSE